MNLKKSKIIIIILTFLLAFPSHFIYEKFPNEFTIIFFPVNESIWEHMKLLVTPVLVGGLIEYLYLRFFHIHTNNYFFFLILLSILSIPLYLLFFLPVYYHIGENMIYSITLMFLIFLLIHCLHYFLIHKDIHFFSDYLAIIIIIATYLVFGYLTYKPLKNDLFFDKIDEKYGTNIYLIK